MKPILNHHTTLAWSWNLLISPPWSQFSPASWNQTNQTIPVLLDSAAFKNIFKIWYQSQITMIERIKGPQPGKKKKKHPKQKPHKCSIQKKQLADTWWHFTSLDLFLCFGNTNIRALTICILPMTIRTFLVLNFTYLKLIMLFFTCLFHIPWTRMWVLWRQGLSKV